MNEGLLSSHILFCYLLNNGMHMTGPAVIINDDDYRMLFRDGLKSSGFSVYCLIKEARFALPP